MLKMMHEAALEFRMLNSTNQKVLFGASANMFFVKIIIYRALKGKSRNV